MTRRPHSISDWDARDDTTNSLRQPIAENGGYAHLSLYLPIIGREPLRADIVPSTREQHDHWSMYGFEQSVLNFWSRVALCDDGCMVWQGTLNKHGYGRCGSPYWNETYAHRMAWEMLYGPPPAKGSGFELDHFECHNHACVNVFDHIQVSTVADNRTRQRRCVSLYCAQGHEMFGPGVYINPRTGQRTCKRCVREATDRWLNRDGNRERQNALRAQRRVAS